jgi:hypothetical protein
MATEPKELHDELPEHADKIQRLKEQNPDFRAKMEEYHELSRAVHRMETTDEPQEEVAETEMRRKRDAARDELFRLILH